MTYTPFFMDFVPAMINLRYLQRDEEALYRKAVGCLLGFFDL